MENSIHKAADGAAEDARLAYLLKEQEVIEGLSEAIDDSMRHTEAFEI